MVWLFGIHVSPSGTFHHLNRLSIYGIVNWDLSTPFWNIPPSELLVHSCSVLLALMVWLHGIHVPPFWNIPPPEPLVHSWHSQLGPNHPILEHSTISTACSLMLCPVGTDGVSTWDPCPTPPFWNIPPPELSVHHGMASWQP